MWKSKPIPFLIFQTTKTKNKSWTPADLGVSSIAYNYILNTAYMYAHLHVVCYLFLFVLDRGGQPLAKNSWSKSGHILMVLRSPVIREGAMVAEITVFAVWQKYALHYGQWPPGCYYFLPNGSCSPPFAAILKPIPNFTIDLFADPEKVKQCQQIVGELAFQLDRSILSAIFLEQQRLYGYQVANIEEKILQVTNLNC